MKTILTFAFAILAVGAAPAMPQARLLLVKIRRPSRLLAHMPPRRGVALSLPGRFA